MWVHADGPRRMTATSGAAVAGMQYNRGFGSGTTFQRYRRLAWAWAPVPPARSNRRLWHRVGVIACRRKEVEPALWHIEPARDLNPNGYETADDSTLAKPNARPSPPPPPTAPPPPP